MKKNYIKPEIIVHELELPQLILAGSLLMYSDEDVPDNEDVL